MSSLSLRRTLKPNLPDWLLDRVVVHGLTALTMDLGFLGSRARASAFGACCAAAGVQLLGSVSVDLVTGPDRWGNVASEDANAHFDPAKAGVLQSGWIGSSEAAIASTAIRLAADAGAPILSLVHGQPDRANRYWPEPKLADQLQRIETNVRTLLPLAADLGVTLALEPHLDYRCAELIQVVGEDRLAPFTAGPGRREPPCRNRRSPRCGPPRSALPHCHPSPRHARTGLD